MSAWISVRATGSSQKASSCLPHLTGHMFTVMESHTTSRAEVDTARPRSFTTCPGNRQFMMRRRPYQRQPRSLLLPKLFPGEYPLQACPANNLPRSHWYTPVFIVIFPFDRIQNLRDRNTVFSTFPVHVSCLRRRSLHVFPLPRRGMAAMCDFWETPVFHSSIHCPFYLRS